MNRHFKCDPEWTIALGSAQCAEANCHVPIVAGDPALYFHDDAGLYGSRCGHGTKAEREFAPHRLRRSSRPTRAEWMTLTTLLVVAAFLIGVLIGTELSPPDEIASACAAVVETSSESR